MQVPYREVLRCLLEGIEWLLGPEWEVKVTGKPGEQRRPTSARGVKRKRSNFPLRRGHASGARRLNYSQHTMVLQ